MNEVLHRLEMKEFTNDQIREIQEGIEEGLDVTVYAKKEFLAIQMQQIRMGLLKVFRQKSMPEKSTTGFRCRVSYYRSPMYTAHEMCKRRIFMEENPDIVCNLETQELSPEETFPDSQTAWRWHSGLQGC